jgi:GT2 family glycosyltransferase
VAVSYNTRGLIALLLWSIHRLLRGKVAVVVVVDNGSVDGSRALLEVSAEAGLCSLIANDSNRYHGPALNQALSYLAACAERDASEPIGWVWLLDSDCVVVRPDTLVDAIAAATRTTAGLMGERRWDPWQGCDRLAAHSLFLDPAQAWRPGSPPLRKVATRPSSSSALVAKRAWRSSTFRSCRRAM